MLGWRCKFFDAWFNYLDLVSLGVCDPFFDDFLLAVHSRNVLASLQSFPRCRNRIDSVLLPLSLIEAVAFGLGLRDSFSLFRSNDVGSGLGQVVRVRLLTNSSRDDN